MKGGGAPKNFEKKFSTQKFFRRKIFFGFKKLIHIVEKVFPNLNIETHLVPVVGRTPECSWDDPV